MRWPFDDRMPWIDRSGRFSAFRATVFAGLLVPPALLAGRALGDGLGPRPITEAIHTTGDWAARLLVLTIVLTPLRQVSGRSELAGIRRMVGLAAFFLAAAHVVLYAADLDFDLGRVGFEILVRPYLTIGSVAVLGLLALALTSTDGAVRRLGGGAWRRLHGLVHPIAILALIHVFLQSRLDLSQGAILAGVAIGGLAIRLAADRDRATGATATLAAVAAAGVAAALCEAAWFTAKTGRSMLPILSANLDAGHRIPPAWIATGLTATALLLARLLRRRRRDRSPRV